MTTPNNPFAGGVTAPAVNPFGQPTQAPPAAPVAAPQQPPANQWLGTAAAAGDGLGDPEERQDVARPGVESLKGHLLLLIPKKLEIGVKGEYGPQDRMTTDVVVLATPGGAIGPVTFSWYSKKKREMLTLSASLDGAPFILDPANKVFPVFPGMFLSGGALVDGLRPCLDPNRPDITMVAAWLEMPTGNSGNPYYALRAATPEQKALARVYISTLSQFG